MGKNTLWLESNEGNTGNLVIRDDNNKKNGCNSTCGF